MDRETAKKKWNNYWYYYKWHTLVGVFIIIVLIVSIKSCMTRINPDIQIMLRTNFFIPEESVNKMENALAPYCKDYNGDGKTVVFINNIYISEDNPAMLEMKRTNEQKVMVLLASGDTPIIFGNKDYIDSLNEQFPLFKTESMSNENSNIIKLNDFEFMKQNSIELEDDIYIGMVDYSGRKGDILKKFNQSKEFLDNLLNNRVVK